FGDRFVDRQSLLAIALSNLNPTIHMGIALGNMTRMERGETWGQAENVTPNVGRLLEELDRERLAVATALGLEVRTIFQHVHLSFGVPFGSASEMHQAMHAIGKGGAGPTTADSRYVTEDVPFGLVPTAKLGRLAGHPALLHEAGVQLFSAMYGRDFSAENDLLTALDIDSISLAQLQTLCRDGY
ncbi:NAD/NADP octopine/nopaline dehydrogenase family protein, partial [Reyranella sp.]|uniref:NAD/NADP octopine/nopaline dehydrogenase family protein n=1 Tax=Reyranella sp. TaxID=1929291 RepID=UPI002731FF1C